MSLISDTGSLSQQKTGSVSHTSIRLLHSSYLDSVLCCVLSSSLPGGHAGPPPGVPLQTAFLSSDRITRLLCSFAGVVGRLLIVSWFSEVMHRIEECGLCS